MTKTIQKSAGQLIAGDIIPMNKKLGARVVVTGVGHSVPEGGVSVCTVSLDTTNPRVEQFPMGLNEYVTVESSQLVTREQLDLLLDAATFLSVGGRQECPSGEKLRAILDELRPPSPPTLEEALEVMAGFDSLERGEQYTRALSSQMDKMRQFLARARRSGKL